MEERVLLYSVVYANEAEKLSSAIRRIDPQAFIRSGV
jgi:uncharacterized membrane-anchored protein YitT (DUF2179 family)